MSDASQPLQQPAPQPRTDFFAGSRLPGGRLTLQKTFIAEGDITHTGLDSVLIRFSYPDRAFEAIPKTTIDGNEQTVIRVTGELLHVDVRQDLAAAEYRAELPAAAIGGSRPLSALNYLTYITEGVLNSASIDHVSFPVSVSFLSEEDGPIGLAETFSVIPYFKNYYAANFDGPPILQGLSGGGDAANRVAAEFIARNGLFINAEAFNELMVRITALRLPLELLPAIAYLTDLSTGVPALQQNLSDMDRAAVMQVLENQQVYGDGDTALALITSYFDRLYDFPVSTAGVKLQQVGGVLTITGVDADVTLTPADFALYDVSLDYEVMNEDGDLELREIHYDWSEDAAEVVDNGMQFSLSDGRLIAPGTAAELMTVTVRSLDGMVLWSKEFHAGASALKAIHISVPLQGTGAVKPNERGRANPLRLRGQILDMTKTATLTGALVLIEAKGPADHAWRVVGSASSDKDGYFSLPYPFGNYVHAQAVVSLNIHAPVPIAVHAATTEGQTICEDFLFLMLREIRAPKPPAGKAGADDCDCHDKIKATRLPDHADLIHSDEYSQDLGAGCLSLSTPNRTLREYSYTAVVRTSDPDVANYTLVKDGSNAGTYMLQGDGKKRKRKAVDLTNPIRWQDAPDMPNAAEGAGHTNASFYQAVTIATGHILHYKSQFKADGYSLGELIYSLPLAPGQKKQIVVFDSSHNLQGSESQSLSLSERLANSLINDRDISDQLGGTISEGLRGSSSATTAGVSVAAGAAGSMGAFGASLGVAGGWSNSNSDASQDSSRSISQFFSEKLRNGLMQNADAYRQQNASVVTTVTEGQKYAATTEVVANHNHCHSLTMMYFEVLKHYAIYQELSNVEECVFVPLLMTNFTKENVFKWRDVLGANLLPLASNAYLPAVNGQHPLARAFDANERIIAKWDNVNYPAARFADDTVTSVTGALNLRVSLPRPKTRYDRILSFPIITKQEGGPSFWDVIKNAIVAPFTAGIPVFGTEERDVQVRAKIFDAFMKLDDTYETVPPAQCIRVVNFKPVPKKDPVLSGLMAMFTGGMSELIPENYSVSGDDFFDRDDADKRAWKAYASILGHADVYAFLQHYFANQLIADWDTIFYNDIAPAVFEAIVKNMKIGGADDSGAPMDGLRATFTSLGRYSRGELTMRLNVYATTTRRRADLPHKLRLVAAPEVRNLDAIIVLRLEDMYLNYTTAHFAGPLYAGYLGQDVEDGALIDIPLTEAELRNPHKQDVFIVTRLLDHLNSNLEHYNKILWYTLDADRRYNLLDGFNIQVYNDHGVPIGLKSVASVIKNELVTVAGNALVFPVAAGFRVSRSYLVEQMDTGGVEKAGLLEHYKPLTPPPPFRLSVPTRGLFVEAVKGVCDSCEKVEDNTSQDWDKFKADEPTGINALSAPTPTVTDWKATFKDIASATLRVQDAPAEPAPGVGLSGLSAALTNADSFRDITGLAKNQSNAVETYKTNTAAAVKMAETAKSLVSMEHNTAKSDQITSMLDKAVASGAITEEDRSKYMKRHIAQVMDGGHADAEEAKATAAKDKAAGAKVLTNTVADSASKGRGVQVQETDGDGNARSIRIDPATTAATGSKGNVLAGVTGDISPIAVPDDKKLGAWAVCTTMMMNWKDGKQMAVPERMAALGADYAKYYDNGKGLPSRLRAGLLTTMKAVSESDTYTLKQYTDLMGAYGPLWVATDYKDDKAEFGNVGFILTKIEDTAGDSADAMLTCIEPYSGKVSTMLCSAFVEKMKGYVVVDDSVLIRIIHFTDKQGGSTGTDKGKDDLAIVPDSGKLMAESHGAVPYVKQPDDMSCWAAAATMMASWQLGYPDDADAEKVKALDIEDVVKSAGDQYLPMFTGDAGGGSTGLPLQEKRRFLSGLGMSSADPMDYNMEAIIQMMKDHGPLWMTMDALTGTPRFAPHAYVITRITGDGTGGGTYFHYFDPAGDAKEQSAPYITFMRGYDQLLRDSGVTEPFPQIVYFYEKESWLKRTDWAAEIKEANKAIADDKTAAKTAGFPVKDDFAEGFKIGGPWNISNTVPAHETLTLAAFRNSTYNKQLPADAKVTWDSRHTTGANKDFNEFFRGVVWNDDPACLLFKDDPKHTTNNFEYTTGAAWLKKFKVGKSDMASVTARSHYGDLQFVHAMASKSGEPANETQGKMMMWAELTYKLALDNDPMLATMRLDSLPMEFDNGKGIMMLKDFFLLGSTDPKDSNTVRDLFLRSTRYQNPILSRRAFGSLLHMIQDSFAIGHTKRELLNPKDMAPEPLLTPYYGNDRFLNWGPVITFHTYLGQGEEHGDWDYAGTNGMDDSDLTSLNRIPGGRNAVEHSKIIINFWNAKTAWEDGPREYLLTKVFPLSKDVTAANGEVR